MTPFPENFVARLKEQRADADELLDALNGESPVSIRLNPKKIRAPFENAAPISWCKTGYFLNERPSFTKDPRFHAGAYYPQEAGSMFIDAILKQLELPDTCVALDLCAAPGGKSTILLDNLSDNALLIANEIVRNRAYILRDNLTRWGKSNVMVTNKSASDFSHYTGLFDLVLVDAPCSGEGMFRKDTQARNEWSVHNAAQCVSRQTDILEDLWPALQQGAYLIYSTCTFNPEENHKQLAKFMENHECEHVELDFPENYNLDNSESKIGYSCLPHKMQTEGFYFAVLRKTEPSRNYQIKSKKENNKKHKNQAPALPNFSIPENQKLVFLNEAFYLIPERQAALMLTLQDQLSCMKLGVRLGEVIGNKWLPHFEYALSVFEKSDFNAAQLNLEQALQYLKGNPVAVEGKDGWQLAQFEGLNLGWLKKIGPRSNNYYPKELRIKMEL
jgi:16S rRNA C967 or C1407 C5-methylase (RsmB/RsmF family)/NOL1/NOP2/fmu family ribosome biogenesis protein